VGANSKTICLPYTPPLDWEFALRFLQARAIAGVESIAEHRYIRTIAVGEAHGFIEVENQASSAILAVTVHGAARHHVDAIAARLTRMFDLLADLPRIHRVLTADSALAPLIESSPGLRVVGTWSAFELIVRAIVGQQVSVKAASTIMGRIVARLGSPLKKIGDKSGLYLFPSPRTLAEDNLDGIGMPGQRVATLREVARCIADGSIPLHDSGDHVEGVKEALLACRGIGPWTVEYFALRALKDPDAWPGTDLALRRAVEQAVPNRSKLELRDCVERWRPWRAYAAIHLWNKITQEQTQAQ
jgi:DNA-3-methyladenine glycosylase II